MQTVRYFCPNVTKIESIDICVTFPCKISLHFFRLF